MNGWKSIETLPKSYRSAEGGKAFLVRHKATDEVFTVHWAPHYNDERAIRGREFWAIRDGGEPPGPFLEFKLDPTKLHTHGYVGMNYVSHWCPI